MMRKRDKHFFFSSLHSIISDLSSFQSLISVVKRNHLYTPLLFFSRMEHVHLIGVLEFPLSRYDLDLSRSTSRRCALLKRSLPWSLRSLSRTITTHTSPWCHACGALVVPHFHALQTLIEARLRRPFHPSSAFRPSSSTSVSYCINEESCR